MKLRRYLLKPMLDDLEAEITYLLVRDRVPSIVVEMSPNRSVHNMDPERTSGQRQQWAIVVLRPA